MSVPKVGNATAAHTAALAKSERETDYSGDAGPIDNNVDKGKHMDLFADESCDGSLDQDGGMS